MDASTAADRFALVVPGTAVAATVVADGAQEVGPDYVLV